MERKNKLVLFLLIVLVMAVALVSSFGLNIFAGNGAEIVLPTPEGSAPGDEESLEGGGQVLPVRTPPKTVQSIIATLTRPDNYARTVTVEMATGTDQAGSVTANVLVDGARTSIELTQRFQPMKISVCVYGGAQHRPGKRGGDPLSLVRQQYGGQVVAGGGERSRSGPAHPHL